MNNYIVENVKILRERTGCSIEQCKDALQLSDNNVEIAYLYLFYKTNAVRYSENALKQAKNTYKSMTNGVQ